MDKIDVLLHEVHKIANVYPAGSGHFVYTGEKHGDGYVDYRPLGNDPAFEKLLRAVCIELLRKAVFEAQFNTREKIVVIGPETMGAKMVKQLIVADSLNLLGSLTICTRILMKDPEDETKFVWSADPSKVLPGAQTLLIDDLLNFSTTEQKAATMVAEYGGKIDALACIGNRCNVTAQQLGLRSITSLEEFPGFTVHEPSVCSLCEANVPIVRKPGHGWKFEQKNPDYRGGFVDYPGQRI